jgi:hypothetical protein
MKKYFLLLICALLLQNGYAQNNQLSKLDIKAYLNDTEIMGPVYTNGYKFNIYDNYANSFVNLVNIFGLLESKTVINKNVIEINSPKIGKFVIIYESPTNIIFKPRPVPFPSTDNSIAIIDDEFYIRINLVRYIISGYTEEAEEKVTLYTRDYERRNLLKLDIKAYLNDDEIKGSVYKNVFGPAIQGADYLSSFVNLVNIFGLLESETVINGNIIEINSPKIGNVVINYKSQTNIIINCITKGLELKPTVTNNSIMIINNEYYIQISMVRYLIKGALNQDEEKVILYTNDYERLDIPLTLNDCYLALNDLLDGDVKEDIKNSSVNDLIEYHMGLGLWIRNNWFRQNNNRITKLLYDNGLRNFDSMSQTIIIGYHYYLNNINKTIQELIAE